jgi:hypothetical protein
MRSVSEPGFIASRSMPDLDPVAIVRVLNKHDVRFVLIGGITRAIPAASRSPVG